MLGRWIWGHGLERIRSSAYLLISIFIKIVVGLLVVKLMAVKLGPDAFGQLGQLMSLTAVLAMFAGGGVANGLIKFLSKSPLDTEEGKAWASAAFSLATFTSCFIGLIIILLHEELSRWVMLGGGALICLVFSQFITGYGSLILAEASSRGRVGLYALINIIGSVLSGSLMLFFLSEFGFEGAVYSLVIMPAATGLIAFFYLFSFRRKVLESLRLGLYVQLNRQLLSFSVLTLVGAVSMPVAQVIVRDSVGQGLGWDQAGYWQGVIKLSDVYMQFVGMLLINYALPKLSAAKSYRLALLEFRYIVGFLLLLLFIGFVTLYFIRGFVVELVFSESFKPVTDLLVPQMLGDLLRTVSAAISIFFLAVGRVRYSICHEMAQGVLFLLAYFVLSSSFGSVAPVYAHVVAYAILAVAMLFLLWFFSQSRRRV